jgi:tetratricopeptide (TPR) repeat protein
VTPKKDFFISYNRHDRAWAEWIAWTLEAAGYSVIIEAWDFRPGENFAVEMQNATLQAEKMIAVLSNHYLNARYTQPEWAAYFRQDPTGERRSLLFVRVQDCQPQGMLGTMIYADLVGLEEAAAKAALLGALQARAKPLQAPAFPQTGRVLFPPSVPQNLPSSGATKFVGRSHDLVRLHELLHSGGDSGEPPPNPPLVGDFRAEGGDRPVHSPPRVGDVGGGSAIASIHGMGGIGKTELALQYALSHYQQGTYPGGLCWLRARDLQIGAQILAFARLHLALTLPEESDLVQLVQWCWRNWRSGDVLVVIDDVTDLNAIREYLPPSADRRFHVLLTTRSRLGAPIREWDIAVLELEEAIALLASLVTDGRVENQRTDAEDLCRWLGYLPLGVELVGRYLADKRDVSLTEMGKRLEAKRLGQKALQDRAGMMTAERGIAAAFELSWAELAAGEQKLGALLSLFALAPLPWDIVQSCCADEDAEELEDERDRLTGLHLVQRLDVGVYQLHPLMQQFLAAKLNERAEAGDLRGAVAAVAAEIAREIPQALTLEDIAKVALAIPHLATVATHQRDALSDDDLSWVFVGIARFYHGQGIYAQAEPWYQDCLTATKERLGDRHPAVATSLNNLAYLYYAQGRYDAAEPLYIEALQLRKDLLGDRHPAVATSLNNLALLYYA